MGTTPVKFCPSLKIVTVAQSLKSAKNTSYSLKALTKGNYLEKLHTPTEEQLEKVVVTSNAI